MNFDKIFFNKTKDLLKLKLLNIKMENKVMKQITFTGGFYK